MPTALPMSSVLIKTLAEGQAEVVDAGLMIYMPVHSDLGIQSEASHSVAWHTGLSSENSAGK